MLRIDKEALTENKTGLYFRAQLEVFIPLSIH